MEAKFKVGDKVRIRDGITSLDTGIDEKYMYALTGRVLTVANADGDNSQVRGSNIQVKEDERWYFKPEWLEPIDEQTTNLTEEQWELFKSGRLVVHCKTETSAENFMAECENHGLYWLLGDQATDHTCYEKYKDLTAYLYNSRGLTFGTIAFFVHTYPDIPVITYFNDSSNLCNHQILITIRKDTVFARMYKNNNAGEEVYFTYSKEDSFASISHEVLNRLFPDEMYSAFSETPESEPRWEPKFHVGDVVEAVDEDMWVKPGMRGVVKVEAEGADDQCGVDFGAAYTGEGLTLDDILTAETGWWMSEEYLRKIR